MRFYWLKEEARQEESRGPLRKLAILEATLKIISEEGMEALTFARIAAQLKIRKSLVSYHYGSLEELIGDLFQLVCRRGQRVTEAAVRNTGSLEEKLAGIIGAAF